MSKHIDIVFEYMPRYRENEGAKFVEVENSHGHSVRLGEWIFRDDGYWVLRFTKEDVEKIING